MNKIIVIRHGAYDGKTGSLNDASRQQVIALAEKIKGISGDGSCLILSSPAKRAEETAAVIAERFGTCFQQCAQLSGEAHFDQIAGLVKESQSLAETIIVVTHGGQAIFLTSIFVSDFPEHFNCGQAYLIDLEAKTDRFIS